MSPAEIWNNPIIPSFVALGRSISGRYLAPPSLAQSSMTPAASRSRVDPTSSRSCGCKGCLSYVATHSQNRALASTKLAPREGSFHRSGSTDCELHAYARTGSHQSYAHHRPKIMAIARAGGRMSSAIEDTSFRPLKQTP